MSHLIRDRKNFLSVLVICCFALVFIFSNWVGVVDDAYIFFRYAHNIRLGHGYVFNIGQPVEGATSVSWTLLLAALDVIHIPPESSVKILGTLCVLAILVVIGLHCGKSGISGFSVLTVLALLVFNKNFLLSIMLGLETGLYALLLLIFCVLIQRYMEQDDASSSIALGGVGILLCLTRPEAAGILVLVGCGMVLFRSPHRKFLLTPIVIWIVGLLLVTIWRWATFGDFIPNSARAKSVLEFAHLRWSMIGPRLMAGSLYVWKWGSESGVLVLLGVVGFAGLRRWPFWMSAACAALCVGVSVAVLNSGDWMPYSRLLTPYLPLVALLAVQGLHRLKLLFEKMRPRYFEFTTLLVVTAISANMFWSLRGKAVFVLTPWPSGECYRKVAQSLHPYLSGDTVVAPEAVGQVGYELGNVPVLDFFGLTDSFIARNGVIPIETYTMGKHHYEYTMQQKPALFIFHSDLNNHVPLLNAWGYSQQYETLRVVDRAGASNLSALEHFEHVSVVECAGEALFAQ